MIKYTNVDVYLFDEPTDSLDEEGISLFLELIKELVDKSKTVIIATHEPSYFMNLLYEEVLLC